MSNSAVPASLRELWEIKQRAEDETRGFSREELAQYYQAKADEAERRLGISLNSRPAAVEHDAPDASS